ncbi:MAG: J domain-containing protein [Alphaproteobacteria bacterium]|nr:J domain-containing protein [Alphaproteobacteria bacterium]
MIKKCDFQGCDKAGICRAPKSRDLKEYHFFCREHAAEYNKNWNFYQGMTNDEVEADWERTVFGTPLKDKTAAQIDTADYLNFLNGFLTGRGDFDRAPKRPAAATRGIVAALKTLELSPTATLRDVRAAYRRLAKLYHPDTASSLNAKSAAEKFAEISTAYKTLEKHYKK